MKVFGKYMSGSSLKIIAIIAMVIDHFGASLLVNYINSAEVSQSTYETLCQMYYITRYIGRIAFPIFIFLLVEGVAHTHNKYKYAASMFIFAFISEIPFDLCFNHSSNILEFSSQNVFFTLGIGLVVIITIEKIMQCDCNSLLKSVARVAVVFLGGIIAHIMNTDYSWVGVFAIAIMYLYKEVRIVGALAMCTMLMGAGNMQIYGFAAVIPIALYNGKRGINLKWFFYAFYPVHLLVYWIVGNLV